MRPHPFVNNPPKTEAELAERLAEAMAKLPRIAPPSREGITLQSVGMDEPPARPQPSLSALAPFSRLHRFIAAVEKNFKETKSQSRALSLAIGWLLGYPAMHLQGYLLAPPVAEADLLTAMTGMPARMDS